MRIFILIIAVFMLSGCAQALSNLSAPFKQNQLNAEIERGREMDRAAMQKETVVIDADTFNKKFMGQSENYDNATTVEKRY